MNAACSRRRKRARRQVTAGLALAFLLAEAAAAWSACRPMRPLPPVVLSGPGLCRFDAETLSFAGDSLEQARCLLRPVKPLGHPGPVLDTLPPVLARVIGSRAGLPDRVRLSTLLWKEGLDRDFATQLWEPLSRANDNDPHAPAARYFVIHDTSGPYYGRRSFPADIDTHAKINNLARYRCADGWEGAHVFINRSGAMLRGHDFSVPWRATKFERAQNFDGALKGLFLHVEMTQPRRAFVHKRRHYDSAAPSPGFTTAQYDRLALLYVIASARGGRWLVPAFHAVIDNGIRGGHDDPQNFDLDAFARSLDTLIERIAGGTKEALWIAP